MDKKYEQLKEWIDESKYIVFFGGAGVSTESGIPDFRSENGIFQAINEYGVRPEVILSHSFFVRSPEVFFKYYKKTLLYPDAKPNDCHRALAKLEQDGKLKAVVTQNIDGLHQAAGSKKVYELHGSVHRNYCEHCHALYDARYILDSKGVPVCEKCGGPVKPDVVLYEEGLDMATMQGATAAINSADLLIIGGTSLTVYPAAGLIDYYQGHRLVLINKSVTPLDSRADLLLQGSIGEIFSQLS